MKGRNLAPLLLIPSFALYSIQVTMFTTDLELLICGSYGLAWFLFVARPPYRSPILLGCIAALGLGFSPQRLRLGESLSDMGAAVAGIHFMSTAATLWVGRKATAATVDR